MTIYFTFPPDRDGQKGMVKKASIQNQTNSSTINKSSGGFVCNCGKTCSQIVSCEEAYFQLNNCGCSARDGDDDEVSCESICPGG